MSITSGNGPGFNNGHDFNPMDIPKNDGDENGPQNGFASTPKLIDTQVKRLRNDSPLNDKCFEDIQMQLESERRHSKKLINEITEMRNQISELSKNISQMSSVISELQSENKKLTNLLIDKSRNDMNVPGNMNTAVNECDMTSDLNNETKTDKTNKNNQQQETESISVDVSIEQVNDIPKEKEIEIKTDQNTSEIIVSEEAKNKEFITKRSNNVPPIDVWTEESLSIQKRLNAALPKFSCTYAKVNKSKFRIFSNNKEIRQKIIEFLSDRGYHFNTYTPPDEKMVNILLKNTDIEDADFIKEELLSIGIEPVKVQRHTTGYMRQNNVAPKIWHLILKPNTDTKVLFNKRNIGPYIVKYEYMRKPSVMQCKKCQRFNHAASSCFMPYRCVKCAGDHGPGNCALNNETNKSKPKCANCNGEHTANDAKRCPVFQRAIKIRDEKKDNKYGEHNG